jgi:hypothetical protein
MMINKLTYSVGPDFSADIMFMCLKFSQQVAAIDFLDDMFDKIQTSHAEPCVSKVCSLIWKRDSKPFALHTMFVPFNVANLPSTPTSGMKGSHFTHTSLTPCDATNAKCVVTHSNGVHLALSVAVGGSVPPRLHASHNKSCLIYLEKKAIQECVIKEVFLLWTPRENLCK